MSPRPVSLSPKKRKAENKKEREKVLVWEK